MQNVNRVLSTDELVQADNFVGWVYSINYDAAWVMTNDLWKVEALGTPHNSFLIAALFDTLKMRGTSGLGSHPRPQFLLPYRVLSRTAGARTGRGV
jgi:hypothetical protein